MKKYEIYAGLNGGFNSLSFKGIEKHIDDDSAYESAWEYACEEYDSYAGLHGLSSFEDCLERCNGDEEEAEMEYNEERDNWLSYTIKEIKE